jgi:hypothetical protein
MWLRIWSRSSCREHGNEPSGYEKDMVFLLFVGIIILLASESNPYLQFQWGTILEDIDFDDVLSMRCTH